MYDKKKRAEDILAEENFSKEFLSTKEEAGSIDANEKQNAQKIYSFLSSSGENLSFSEKEQIKNQIRFSIRKLSTKRLLIRVSIAAAILFALVITSVFYFRVNSTSEISNYAQTHNHVQGYQNFRD